MQLLFEQHRMSISSQACLYFVGMHTLSYQSIMEACASGVLAILFQVTWQVEDRTGECVYVT